MKLDARTTFNALRLLINGGQVADTPETKKAAQTLHRYNMDKDIDDVVTPNDFKALREELNRPTPPEDQEE